MSERVDRWIKFTENDACHEACIRGFRASTHFVEVYFINHGDSWRIHRDILTEEAKTLIRTTGITI